jgi:ribonuclease-3
VYGSGEGRSKKEAEQQAAEAAWTAISNGEPPLDSGDGPDGSTGKPPGGQGGGSGPNHHRPGEHRSGEHRPGEQRPGERRPPGGQGRRPSPAG